MGQERLTDLTRYMTAVDCDARGGRLILGPSVLSNEATVLTLNHQFARRTSLPNCMAPLSRTYHVGYFRRFGYVGGRYGPEIHGFTGRNRLIVSG